MGSPGLLGRRPQAIPGRIAGVEVEHVDDRTPVAQAGDPFELGHRGLGRMTGQEGEGAQPVGCECVELLDGPVVPRRVARGLQVRLGDGQGQRDGTVDDRGPHPVEVHVLQPQLRIADPEAVVLEAGPADGAERLELVPRGQSAAAEDTIVADPHRIALAGHHPWAPFDQVLRQP